jgi:hypothetical protein
MTYSLEVLQHAFIKLKEVCGWCVLGCVLGHTLGHISGHTVCLNAWLTSKCICGLVAAATVINLTYSGDAQLTILFVSRCSAELVLQWAATRHDIFAHDVCDALEKLHTQAPAHSFR